MRQNDSRKLKLEALNERRRQVVECRKRGMTQKEVSTLCGMSTVTVGKIDRLYKVSLRQTTSCELTLAL